MYSNRFLFNIVLNGKNQDELANGEVRLPFNAEYGIWLQNKHRDKRAVAQIFIDGENVSGGGYVLRPSQGFLIKRHSAVDKAFKFVSLDSKAAKKAGKDGPNEDKQKGVVEVRFFLEKEVPQQPITIIREKTIIKEVPTTPPYNPWPEIQPYTPINPNPYKPFWTCQNTGNSYSGGGIHGSSVRSTTYNSSPTVNFCDEPNDLVSKYELKDGCTVGGSTTGQQFRSTSFDAESDYTSLKVFLVGYNEPQQQYANVDASKNAKYCSNCGAKVHKKDKFCAICGHRLI